MKVGFTSQVVATLNWSGSCDGAKWWTLQNETIKSHLGGMLVVAVIDSPFGWVWSCWLCLILTSAREILRPLCTVQQGQHKKTYLSVKLCKVCGWRVESLMVVVVGSSSQLVLFIMKQIYIVHMQHRIINDAAIILCHCDRKSVIHCNASLLVGCRLTLWGRDRGPLRQA